MKYAVNAYTGNWVLVETIAVFKTRDGAERMLLDCPWFAQSRPGLTLVIEEVGPFKRKVR